MGSQSFASFVHDYGSTLEATSTGPTGGHRIEVTVGQVSTGFIAIGNRNTPREYHALGGVPRVDPASILQIPMLFVLEPRQGAKAGGDHVTLWGAFLNSTAGQAPSIWIDALPVSNLQIVDDARIEFDVPNGTDPTTRNPRGSVKLRYATGIVLADVFGAYAYLPALTGPTSVSIDSEFSMVLRDRPEGRLMTLWVGASPTLISLGPLGSVVIAPMLEIVPPTLVSNGALEARFTLPNDPGLVGLQVIVQGMSLTSLVPLQGNLTNPLTIDFTLN
ncbi:MAG: hypothetical protein H6833_07535 [Planctomycetes bacterium]|nr:hypothetical protein [Planctomycetota bacterium]